MIKGEEASVGEIVEELSRIADRKFGLIKNFGRVLQYYDEPKPWQYSASINNRFVNHDGSDFRSVASGVSFFSEKLAVLKCLGEAIERYCNFAFFSDSTTFVGSYREIRERALDPKCVVGFSQKQLGKSSFEKFRVSDESRFSWTEGASLIFGRKILIPSQLVYLSYPRLSDEPIIYPSISTGTAGGSSLSAALVRGICEIIERDAFMMFYLNKLPPPRIDLGHVANDRVRKLLQVSKKYDMEIISLDVTTDIPVPTFLSIVIDRTGIGKAVCVGLKSNLDPITALVGSIEETFNTRTWLRTEYEKSGEEVTLSDLLKKSDIRTRGLLWYPKHIIKELDFLIRSPETQSSSILKRVYASPDEQLKQLVSIFNQIGYDVIYKNITMSIFKKLGFFVVKVLVSRMQPFYLDEKYKLLGGERLYEVPVKLGFAKKTEDELNTFPHPFL